MLPSLTLGVLLQLAAATPALGTSSAPGSARL